MPRRRPVLKSWNWFLIRASVLVTLCHIGIVWSCLPVSSTPTPIPAPKRVVVATVKLKPPATPQAASRQKSQSAPAPPKPQPPSKPSSPPKPVAKPASKPKPVEKVAKAPAPPDKSTQEKRQQKLLKEAQERIAKIGAREESSKQNSLLSAVSDQIPQLQIDRREQPVEGKEASYCSELAQRLRLMLRLPEYGEVRLLLSLGRDGRVVSVQVTETQSDRNRSYVVDKLTGGSFPPFGSLFPGSETESFPIILGNEL